MKEEEEEEDERAKGVLFFLIRVCIPFELFALISFRLLFCLFFLVCACACVCERASV